MERTSSGPSRIQETRRRPSSWLVILLSITSLALFSWRAFSASLQAPHVFKCTLTLSPSPGCVSRRLEWHPESGTQSSFDALTRVSAEQERTGPTSLSSQPSEALLSKAEPTTAPLSGAPPPKAESPKAESPKAESPSHPSHAHHRFTDTERYVKMFEDPARAEYQKPQEVVEALHLHPGQVVADIGAGSGYFSFPMARAVGPEGKVYAIDIEPGMIDSMKTRAKKEGAANVETILAKPDDAGLPGSSVDLVFICNTWHHIQHRVDYVRRLGAALKPGGRIAIVDYQKRPLPVGPRVEDKIDRADVVKEVKEAGFSLVEEPTFLPYQYFLIFAPSTP